ncbi:hypothetical protein KAI30_01740 [Candidatus Bathyarchaeota archaeon]|nr:hypothetical protein [Candidatus Bathyarchaeota archaeon]
MNGSQNYNSLQPEDQPRVWVGIPTGPPKNYALLTVLAALERLQYSNFEVHLAVTTYADGSGDWFLDRVKLLSTQLKMPISIHPTQIEKPEDAPVPFIAVLRNFRKLRHVFLDGDCSYFLSLGGDNPPPQRTIQRLLALEADVASGVCYQRPGRGQALSGVYPLLWTYTWTLDELPVDLEEDVYEQFVKAWLNSTFMIPVNAVPGWRRRKRLEYYSGGTGCTLIKRGVLERVGFELPVQCYHSEDMHFFNKANLRGFTTRCDMKFHVPHMLPEGGSV